LFYPNSCILAELFEVISKITKPRHILQYFANSNSNVFSAQTYRYLTFENLIIKSSSETFPKRRRNKIYFNLFCATFDFTKNQAKHK